MRAPPNALDLGPEWDGSPEDNPHQKSQQVGGDELEHLLILRHSSQKCAQACWPVHHLPNNLRIVKVDFDKVTKVAIQRGLCLGNPLAEGFYFGINRLRLCPAAAMPGLFHKGHAPPILVVPRVVRPITDELRSTSDEFLRGEGHDLGEGGR